MYSQKMLWHLHTWFYAEHKFCVTRVKINLICDILYLVLKSDTAVMYSHNELKVDGWRDLLFPHFPINWIKIPGSDKIGTYYLSNEYFKPTQQHLGIKKYRLRNFGWDLTYWGIYQTYLLRNIFVSSSKYLSMKICVSW